MPTDSAYLRVEFDVWFRSSPRKGTRLEMIPKWGRETEINMNRETNKNFYTPALFSPVILVA